MNHEAIRILIVDDDDDDAFLIKDLIGEGLTNPSPTLDRAKSQDDALRLLDTTPYSLCICDYRLGEGNASDC